MKSAAVLLVAGFVACGGPANLLDPTPDGGDGSGSGSGSGSGGPTEHVGGWRMRGGDGSLAYRSAGAGPAGNAAMNLVYQNPSSDQYAGLGTPIVDELGNVYLIQTTPMQPNVLVALGPTGTKLWQTTLEANWAYGEVTIGPDGDLYAVATMGSGATAAAKLVSFDGKTGVSRSGSQSITGLARILMPADGSIYALTYTETDGYGFQALPAMGATPRWTKTIAGDAYAVSPHGDAIAMVDVGAGTPAPALDVVSLDPATGTQRWHYTLDAALMSPTIAIDTDGTTYVSASLAGSGLHLIRLSSTGTLLQDLLVDSLTYPSRILIGTNTVSVSCQTPQYTGAGFTIEKSTGDLPTGWTTPCGEPEAVDKNDQVFWGCDGGIQATNAAGQATGGWQGNYTFQVVLAPNNTAYAVPAAYFAANQLFRIR
jgi:PQQ-like domain